MDGALAIAPDPGRAARVLGALNPFAVRRTRGQWTSDGIVFALALAFWAWDAGGATEYPAVPAEYWPVDLALGLAATLSLWWLRRYPLVIGAWLVVPGTLSLTAAVAVVAGVYRMASLAPIAPSVALTIAHILFALPYHAVAPLPGMSWAVWFVVIPLIYSLSLTLGLLARARRQLIEGLRESVERDRERHLAELASLRRDERERIAREMHDVLAHRISLLSVHAGALEYRSSPAQLADGRAMSAGEIHSAAGVIRSNAHLAVDELREVLSVLRDADDGVLAAARRQPRLADVPTLVEEAERAGQTVGFIFAIPEGQVRESVERTAYRVVQEGLTNARKHAARARVEVAIEPLGDALRVVVANPIAPGFTAAEIPGVGAGLAGLEERVRIDGGAVSYGVVDGRFELEARLPLVAS